MCIFIHENITKPPLYNHYVSQKQQSFKHISIALTSFNKIQSSTGCVDKIVVNLRLNCGRNKCRTKSKTYTCVVSIFTYLRLKKL